EVGEAEGARARRGLPQPLEREGDGGRIDFGHTAEIDYPDALPQVVSHRCRERGNGREGQGAVDEERIAFQAHHDLPAFAASGSRFLAASDLIRPSIPRSRTSLANVSR